MLHTVADRGRYFYNYSSYFPAYVLREYCCCSCLRKTKCYRKRVKKLERHEAAMDKLGKEVDIVQMLKVLRISSFLSKTVLKRHQRGLITSFDKY